MTSAGTRVARQARIVELVSTMAVRSQTELAKILAFVAGGVGAWLAVQWVLPQAQELWAVFLCGGLFGVLLYRLWTMMLTSLAGTLPWAEVRQDLPVFCEEARKGESAKGTMEP